MTKQTEAMKLALEALEALPALNWIPEKDMQAQTAITALREALDHIASGGKMIEQPAQPEHEPSDTDRLDWLNNNFFNRENLDWNGDVSKEYLMWVFFAPKGVQGDIRRVIDAAKLKELNTCTPAKYHNA